MSSLRSWSSMAMGFRFALVKPNLRLDNRSLTLYSAFKIETGGTMHTLIMLLTDLPADRKVEVSRLAGADGKWSASVTNANGATFAYGDSATNALTKALMDSNKIDRT